MSTVTAADYWIGPHVSGGIFGEALAGHSVHGPVRMFDGTLFRFPNGVPYPCKTHRDGEELVARLVKQDGWL